MADDLITMTPSSIVVSESPEALSSRVAADFASLAAGVLAQQPRFTVALAGGSTPKLFYARLAKEPYRSAVDWSKIWFFWGDERCVPQDHPDSNFRMASETLLQHVPVNSAHVYRMHGEDPPPVAARDYETAMRGIYGAANPWPSLDLILLGLGTDGHTASLMPGTPALAQGDRWVVGNVVRSLQTVRITMTLPVINNAHHVWFLATGAKKQPAFARAQGEPNPECPASLVHPESGDLRWYVDNAVLGNVVESPSQR